MADPQPLNALAVEIQDRVRQLANLAHAIDDAIDFKASDSAEHIIERLGRALSFIALHEEITPKVLAMAEEIETRTLRDGGSGHG